MDRSVYPGSLMARVPSILRPVAFLVRYAADQLATRGFTHRSDGILSRNNDSYRKTPAFQHAYHRSVQASGWDYGIPWRVHQALWCAATAPEGCFVELGTGRGFVMSAVMDTQPIRTAHLFDTFDPHYIAADGTQTGNVSQYYAESFEAVRNNFAEWPTVHLHRGDIFKTLPEANLGPVAFVHIDLNHPEVEVFSLRHIWPHVALGGVLLFDDYAYIEHESQYAAINAVASDLGFAILSTPTGQGIAVKNRRLLALEPSEK